MNDHATIDIAHRPRTRTYRVLVQAGHRVQTGAARESALVSAIQRELVARLKAHDRFEPISLPGDVPEAIRVDAALFLHADVAAHPNERGFSFGYAPHPVNWQLADLLRAEFLRLAGHPPARADRYLRRDMSRYYDRCRVSTEGPQVLVENRSLTSSEERRWLRANVGPLADAEYRALCRYFDVPAKGLEAQEPSLRRVRPAQRRDRAA